jgi:Rrf2 family protein
MISTKGRYALRVMIDLAEQEMQNKSNGHSDTIGGVDNSGCTPLNERVYIPLKDVAKRQGISKKYLEIIMRELVSGGLVAGASGKGGGYRLLRPAGEYTLGEILDLTETSMAAVACLASDAEPCPRAATCPTLPVWIEYDRLVKDFFHSKRLSDLVPPADGQKALK